MLQNILELFFTEKERNTWNVTEWNTEIDSNALKIFLYDKGKWVKDGLINVIEIADKQFGSLAVYHISFTEIQIKHWIFKKSNHSSKQTWVFTVLKCGKPFTVRQKNPKP